MFEKRYDDRLTEWREFRDSLEESDDPFSAVISFYSKAPYVSHYTDPYDETRWPTPWELLEENQYCDFNTVLGMCYSLQLTERFKGSIFEIHIVTSKEKAETVYFLVVDNVAVFDNNYMSVSDLPQDFVVQKKYTMPNIH